MKVYASKVDRWLIVVFVLSIAASLAGLVMVVMAGQPQQIALSALPMVLGIGLPLWLLRATHYRLDDRELLIVSGPFRWRIAVVSIANVVPTRSALSSPALSLDRLRIDYGQGRSIMVSPLERERFLRDLDAVRAKQLGKTAR